MKKLTVMALFFASLGFSQVNTSRLDGVVTDPTGAAVPGVEVTVTNLATDQSFKSTTAEDGRRAVPSRAGAKYKIAESNSGFRVILTSGIEAGPGFPATVN